MARRRIMRGGRDRAGLYFQGGLYHGGLEDGLCNPGDTVDVGNGIYMYKGARMTDHNMNKGGYGRISVEQAIWYSSNIGVAKTI